MTRKLMTIPGMAVLLLVGCGGPNRNDTGPAAGAGAETGAVPGGTGQFDTTTTLPPDSSAMPVDSARGPGATQARPDQSQPVTSKGDTIGTSGQPGSPTGDTGSSSQ